MHAAMAIPLRGEALDSGHSNFHEQILLFFSNKVRMFSKFVQKLSKGHILIAASIYLNFRSTGRCFRQIEINFGQINANNSQVEKQREREWNIFKYIWLSLDFEN